MLHHSGMDFVSKQSLVYKCVLIILSFYFVRIKINILIWQLVPVKFGRQEQTNELPELMHEAPFRHGELEHASTV